MPSAQDCAERLREQAYKTLLPQIQELEGELQSVKNSVSTGIQQIGQKLDVLRHIELPTTELILGEILGEVSRQKELETSALALFGRDVLQKETQEEILTLLLDDAKKYLPRVALLAVRGDQFVGWSSRGYTESAARAISSCVFPCSEYPRFQEAFEVQGPISASDLPDSGPLASLKEDAQGPWRVFALRVMQRPVALLVAGEAKGIPSNPDALSVLVSLTALRLENIVLKILYEMAGVKLEPAPQPMPVAAVPAAAPAAVPESSMEIPVAPPAAAHFQMEEPIRPAPPVVFRPEPIPEPVRIPEPVHIPEPIFAPEPIATPEPIPFHEPEPIPEVIAAAPAVEEFFHPVSAPVEAPAPAPPLEAPRAKPQEVRPIPEEERLHSDAKRFARLLVSEIKLYNEHHVVEGRANRDLYLRLKRDIDRSREMYEKRISPNVSRKIDYFHDEIIRILGDNDPSTLGTDYPGPRVDS